MPLFNHFPYLDVQNLNLNWIISKIKGIDQTAAQVEELSVNLPEYAETASQAASAATLAANNAQSAAETSAELITQAERANVISQQTKDFVQETYNQCEAIKSDVVGLQTECMDAQTACTAAQTACTNAEQNAAQSAQDASTDAGRSETAAQRAETAASTEGFTGRSGDISAGSASEIAILPGDYIITYKVNDTESSSGLMMLHVTAAYTADIRKLITYTGSTGITLTVDSSAHTLRIRSTFTQAVHWLLLGFNNGQ